VVPFITRGAVAEAAGAGGGGPLDRRRVAAGTGRAARSARRSMHEFQRVQEAITRRSATSARSTASRQQERLIRPRSRRKNKERAQQALGRRARHDRAPGPPRGASSSAPRPRTGGGGHAVLPDASESLRGRRRRPSTCSRNCGRLSTELTRLDQQRLAGAPPARDCRTRTSSPARAPADVVAKEREKGRRGAPSAASRATSSKRWVLLALACARAAPVRDEPAGRPPPTAAPPQV